MLFVTSCYQIITVSSEASQDATLNTSVYGFCFCREIKRQTLRIFVRFAFSVHSDILLWFEDIHGGYEDRVKSSSRN